MVSKLSVAVLCILSVFSLVSCRSDHSHFPELKAPYLGQKPPGRSPEVFAPGIITYGFHELSPTFSPDGSELFYVMSDGDYKLYVIVTTRIRNSIWQKPEIAPFSGLYTDYGVRFSPDGNSLYFSSKRPDTGSGIEQETSRLWKMERRADEWSGPRLIVFPDEEQYNDMNPSVASDGTLYFQRQHEAGGGDIYVSRFVDGKYTHPEIVPEPVSGSHNDGRPFIAPDQSYILFQSSRPGGFGSHDLYVCFRNSDDTWSEAINLGEEINSGHSDFGPSVTIDGKYLFFVSYRTHPEEIFTGKSYDELLKLYRHPANGYASIYWVDAAVIEEKRPRN